MVFEKTEFSFGEIPVNEKVSDSTKIIEGVEDFHYLAISGGCTCTDAKLEGDVLSFDFYPDKSVGALQKGEKKSKPTYIMVFIDKDIPEFIADPLTKKKVTNPDKKIIRLPINFLAVGV